ncbi:MAG: transposase [Bacteroidota bacterium]
MGTLRRSRLSDPRKLACHAGIAPFEHTSGSSIHKAPSVSVMADHELKRMLHLAALAAINTKGELKEYYERKKKEGKPSMLVINAIRNKIVHRVCACVKADKIYQKQYQNPKKAA